MHKLGTIALWSFAALGVVTMVKALLGLRSRPRVRLRERLYNWLAAGARADVSRQAQTQSEGELGYPPGLLPPPAHPDQSVAKHQRRQEAPRTRPQLELRQLPPAPPEQVTVFNDVGRPEWALERTSERQFTTVQ